LVPGPSRG